MQLMTLTHNSTVSMGEQLSKPTSIFGLKLSVVVGICVGASFVLFLFFITFCVSLKRSRNAKKRKKTPKLSPQSKGIPNVRGDEAKPAQTLADSNVQATDCGKEAKEEARNHRIQIETGKDHLITLRGESEEPKSRGSGSGSGEMVPGVSHLGWGRWYTLRELQQATRSFSHENIIGEGGYGIVYFGLLEDGNQVAVKNLLNNKGQAEREFKVEVEAIGRVRHKNLVRLLGYCAEGAHRMLVYEYINNGNLEQWLHGEVGPISPLKWDNRMSIISGTAKGLSYLHEGLEPKVVHRDIKSSNILLDKQWNPKVSDFGLAKLIGSERTYITTRVMGTFGYVAPEYASTGMLNDKSDVYSLGVLMMEIISGRNPVDYSLPKDEVHLVEWVKRMVRERRAEEVLDCKLEEKPALRALKKALLVAIRCVDFNAQKRPKMGQIVHMLEADDVNEERRD